MKAPQREKRSGPQTMMFIHLSVAVAPGWAHLCLGEKNKTRIQTQARKDWLIISKESEWRAPLARTKSSGVSIQPEGLKEKPLYPLSASILGYKRDTLSVEMGRERERARERAEGRL